MADLLWILFCAILVFLMQPGFMCLETGLTRSKNSINVAIKNLLDFCLSILLFWTFGYGLMFGASLAGWIGSDHFFITVDDSPKLAALFIFQAVFCSTATTIVSGAVAERMRFQGYVLITLLTSGLIYPLFGHWAWNQSLETGGWLASRGFIDFAGSTVVHSIGGFVALAALIIIGPRSERFSDGHMPQKIGASNLPMSVLGLMLLWIGWFGFNAGSTLELNEQIPIIIAHTLISGVSGGVSILLFSFARQKVVAPDELINGCLAGLVAITANCHAVTTGESIIIGAIGAGCMLLVYHTLEWYRIDDAVGAVAVHAGAGVWGTLAVALFGDPLLLQSELGWVDQLVVQSQGIGVAFVWGFGFSYLILRLVNHAMPFRVSLIDEQIGLNISEHEAKTESYHLIETMEYQAKTKDLSVRVPVEPFTEMGYIAYRYNEVLSSLQEASHRQRELNLSLQHSNQELEKRVIERTLELAKAKESAEKAHEVKSNFLAKMSHELRTPLNAILGFTQLMSRDPAASFSQKEKLGIINRSGIHLLDLLNDVLDMSKIESGQITLNRRSFDLHCLLNDIHEMFHLKADEKGLVFLFEHKTVLPCYVFGDARKLRQILINLISNAIKFTSDGHVMVRIEHVIADKILKLMFEIEDTGAGVGLDEVDLLFEPFKQTKSGRMSQQGTGLGLPISHQFVSLMGGDMSIKSELGKGSVFKFDVLVEVISDERIEPDMLLTNTQMVPQLTESKTNPEMVAGYQLNEEEIEQLQQAVTLLDIELILSVIAEFHDREPNLAQTLTNWANDFQYEEISTFIQQYVHHHRLQSTV